MTWSTLYNDNDPNLGVAQLYFQLFTKKNGIGLK